MSRLIKKSIVVPEGVSASVASGAFTVKGPKGELSVPLRGGELSVADGKISAGSGTLWALARNAVAGVTEGFVKNLEIEGVGYRAVLEGKELVLHLGYALPVRMKLPEGISVAVEKNMVKVSGIDKDLVGRAAAEIRAMKKPEPYKGKGIRYQGEVIRRKAGKKAASSSA